MRAAACSWRDMRKVRHILANAERLKGEAEALTKCADRTTRLGWQRIVAVMEAVDKLDIQHSQPSHFDEIARRATPDAWPRWVARCEAEQLTVPELRRALLAERAQTAAAVAEATTPEGKFRTLVVDPPWSFGNKSGRQRPEYADRSMSLDQIIAFGPETLERWVPAEAHLYLWVVDAYLGSVDRVFDAWGFVPKLSLVWVKDKIGMGNYFRHQHELCLFAIRGSMRLKRMDMSTVFSAPMTRHSEKPDAFYAMVESCSPGPYLDVFARRKRAGWSVFGDEVATDAAYQTRLDGQNESRVVR